MNKIKTTIEFFKNHYGKILTGTTGTIIFSIAGTMFSDARYAHQKESAKQITELQQQIDELKQKIEKH